MVKKPKGFILDESPSFYDPNELIVSILTTGASENTKTGNMVQSWHFVKSMDPVKAVNTGADWAVCGDCRHRKQADGSRTCYVNMGQLLGCMASVSG